MMPSQPRAVGRKLLGERRRRAAVFEPILEAVPRAGHAAVDDAAFADRPVLMGAEIGQRADLAPSRNTAMRSPPGAAMMRAALSGM